MNILIYLIEVLFLSLMARSITIRIFRLIYWISKSKKLAVWTVWLIFLPGTVIHELSHILFSIILLVPFGNFNLIPQFDEKGIKMGSVSIAKTDVIRRQLIGAAPFIIGNLLLALGFYYFVENKLFSDYLYLLIMIITTFEIANTMFSSKSDIEGLGLLLIILVLCLTK